MTSPLLDARVQIARTVFGYSHNMSAMSAMAAVAPAVQVRPPSRLFPSCIVPTFAKFWIVRQRRFAFTSAHRTPRGTTFATDFNVVLTFHLPPHPPQATFGAKSGKFVKARRSVVAMAVTEPTVEEKKPKRKFVKKNVTVQDADIVIGASFPGKVVRNFGCVCHAQVM